MGDLVYNVGLREMRFREPPKKSLSCLALRFSVTPEANHIKSQQVLPVKEIEKNFFRPVLRLRQGGKNFFPLTGGFCCDMIGFSSGVLKRNAVFLLQAICAFLFFFQ